MASPSLMRRVYPLLLVVVGCALAAWLAVLALVWRFQERVVFQPPFERATGSLPDSRRVAYAAADGAQLIGYLVGDARTAPVVVLVFHGNADLARWQLPWAEELARRTRAAVMIAEYRGYDGLSGPATYNGTQADARAALRFLHDAQGVQSQQLVYFGHSLGSAVATELAAVAPPRALVLQSPFTSAREMALRFPLPGLRWFWEGLSRVHFDTGRRVRELNVPVWVAHGDRDLVVPVRMGRAVFDAAQRKGQLLIVHGAGHNDVAESGRDDYWRWLDGALSAPVMDARRGSRTEPSSTR